MAALIIRPKNVRLVWGFWMLSTIAEKAPGCLARILIPEIKRVVEKKVEGGQFGLEAERYQD